MPITFTGSGRGLWLKDRPDSGMGIKKGKGKIEKKPFVLGVEKSKNGWLSVIGACLGRFRA